MPTFTIDTLVERYIKLRDAIKSADDLHKERTSPAREALEQMNSQLLQEIEKVGGESVRTQHGTVYRTMKKSATIADGDVFRKYVIENKEFDLVDWRANSTAVSIFIDKHANPPPGVNYSTIALVGVRRPGKNG